MEVKKNVILESATIDLVEETEELKKEVASIIDLPTSDKKQADLLYFSAIFVSTGENLNHAYFTPTELLKAKHTIASKALDVEHEEDEIIGHLYDYAFTRKSGGKITEEELATISKTDIEKEDLHVVVAGVIYKNRFPTLAQEVAEGKWKVSMECYFTDYDVKVGDLILARKDAEMMGFASLSDIIGKAGRVIKDGVEIASGRVTRVLKDIMFSGCGIVKNPANPPSVILETANNKKSKKTTENDIIVFDFASISSESASNTEDIVEDVNNTGLNNVTSSSIGEISENIKLEPESASGDTVGICVNYKRRLTDTIIDDQDSKVTAENHCTLFDTKCTSFSMDATDQNCLRNLAMQQAKASALAIINSDSYKSNKEGLLERLKGLIKKAKTIL